MTDDKALDALCIDTIRTLAMDAVEQAKSGHPGTPMALAPVAYEVWQNHMRYDPAEPTWPNRDRFVLSVGHAAMLLYAVLHLVGVRVAKERGAQPQHQRGGHEPGEPAISLDDIKTLRHLDSICAGHPEYHPTHGIETTTGPLGQGVGTSVGMALAERWLAARYNKPGLTLFDHNTYVLCSDGDLMEGISHEAASIAGHLKLSKLCWIYDDNKISIDGRTEIAFSEDVMTRFKGYGWAVHHVADANDRTALARCLDEFKRTDDRPTLIVVQSRIAFGAPKKENTSGAHGSPLGADEIKGAKRAYGWPEDEQFHIPDGVREHFAGGIGKRGAELRASWDELLGRYREEHPELAAELDLLEESGLPDGWDRDIPSFPADEKGKATRVSSGEVMNAIAARVPWMVGGAADLVTSTGTAIKGEGAGSVAAGNYGGRNIHFGIREHATGTLCNGLALSKLRPFGSTFLIFSDYMRPAIRLSALMELPVVWVYTHDSIGLGGDGPTHQPIEHLASLRAIPGLVTLRPGDANEVAEAWRAAMGLMNQPVCMVLSRQNLPTLDREQYASAKGVARGGYVLADAEGGEPEVILIGTGSELILCVQAYEKLKAEGVRARVVSLPSWELFEQQDKAYRAAVLPPDVLARVSVEAAAEMGWDRYTGVDGAKIAMRTFGASAPDKDLYERFGFTVDKVIEAAREQLAARRS